MFPLSHKHCIFFFLFDILQVLETSPSDGKSIDSIAPYSKGFVCGCDEGVLYVFEREEKEIYKQSKSFQIDQNYVRILNISISPKEENVICTLENNQMFVLGLANTDILKTEEMQFEHLSLHFHHLQVPTFSLPISHFPIFFFVSCFVYEKIFPFQITGLDVCLRKPFIVTCGMDRTVRVWNYITHTIEVSNLAS